MQKVLLIFCRESKRNQSENCEWLVVAFVRSGFEKEGVEIPNGSKEVEDSEFLVARTSQISLRLMSVCICVYGHACVPVNICRV